MFNILDGVGLSSPLERYNKRAPVEVVADSLATGEVPVIVEEVINE